MPGRQVVVEAELIWKVAPMLNMALHPFSLSIA